MEVTGFGAGAIWTHQKDFLHGPSGLIATRTATGLIKYFHHDHLGTPRLLTSTAGSTIASFHYYPFGEPATFPENPNADPAYKFTGHERDRSKVTDYMLGRTYAYPFQRFMQVDPARDGWNLYGYVRGNPVNAVDPDGLADELIVHSLAAPPEVLRERALLDDALIEFVKVTADRYPFLPNLTAVSYAISLTGRAALSVGAPASDGEIGVNAMFFGSMARAPVASGRAVVSGGSLNPAQASNLARFNKKLPSGAGETTIRDLPGGGRSFQAEVPGRVRGSKAIYEKQVNAAGKTVEFKKTTIDPSGKVVHVKDKIRGTVSTP